jgi:hypothetical protein
MGCNSSKVQDAPVKGEQPAQPKKPKKLVLQFYWDEMPYAGEPSKPSWQDFATTEQVVLRQAFEEAKDTPVQLKHYSIQLPKEISGGGFSPEAAVPYAEMPEETIGSRTNTMTGRQRRIRAYRMTSAAPPTFQWDEHVLTRPGVDFEWCKFDPTTNASLTRAFHLQSEALELGDLSTIKLPQTEVPAKVLTNGRPTSKVLPNSDVPHFGTRKIEASGLTHLIYCATSEASTTKDFARSHTFR